MPGMQETRMKSIRLYKTSEQYLYAMKEDLAEWLKELYDLDIDVGSFLEVLETGILLCHHANSTTQVAHDFKQRYPGLGNNLQLPMCQVTCNDLAQPGTFQARDNVSNYIQWCRKEMGIQEVLMFETEDLVLRKNEKNFVLCLLEVARRAARFGMSAPTLVQLEEEIEEEIREDLNLPPEETPLPRARRKPDNFRNLDQMVQNLVSCCTCPVQFSMTKVSEGKYRVGDSSALIFVRILRNHVMVRVGGGWDTLEHYLDKHDPCRCTSLSHKQALKMGSPQKVQATQVQHEITARLTPRKNNPHKPQPALIVTRSQSPLPPVEWRTYTLHSQGTGGKVPPSSSSPPNNGGRSDRKTAGLLISPEPSEHRRVPSIRVRERSVTPVRKLSAPEERPGSKLALSAQSGREACCVLFQQNGNMENNLHVQQPLLEPQRGWSPNRVQMLAPQKQKPERLALPGTVARRDAVIRLPGKFQQEMNGPQTRSSSPTKSFQAPYQQPAKALMESSVGPQGGVTGNGWRKDLIARRSPSPIKHVCLVQKENGSPKTSGKVVPTSRRPPALSKSYQETFCLRNGGNNLDKGPASLHSKGLLKNEAALQRERDKMGNLEESIVRLSDSSGDGIGQLTLGPKMKGSRTSLGQESIPGSPCKDDQKSYEDTKEPAGEKERVYTPLPINLAEEQALYRSLEDEILANIRELEEVSEGSYLSRGPQSEGFGMDHDRGRDCMALSPNGQKSFTPTLSPLQNTTIRTSVSGEGVPRSGVYVPKREVRWLGTAGLHYDSVIQELSMTLNQERAGTEESLPLLSRSLVNGNQAEKTFLGRQGAPEENCVAPEMEDEEPSHTVHEAQAEVNTNGGNSQEVPDGVFDSPESLTAPGDTKLPQSKLRRSLKKPERVPSIYKLKLRPKIRPRRDNRPEKRPSKIPTPVACRHAQRGSRVKGQAKAHSTKSQTPDGPVSGRQNNSGNTGSEGRAVLSEYSPSSKQDGDPGRKTTMTEGKMEVSDEEESWV
ncbi:GAS2-like protein 2 [Rhineura floridana]|uniref:GAS2-like protein 2 n=1 Tax=Rhineura floridana TaxID=261503 RepID=UPI002AC84522|nr:GAS2-like protein 2 [Rhineura floridana]